MSEPKEPPFYLVTPDGRTAGTLSNDKGRPSTWDVVSGFLQNETIFSLTRDVDSLRKQDMPDVYGNALVDHIFSQEDLTEDEKFYITKARSYNELAQRWGEVEAHKENELLFLTANGGQMAMAMVAAIAVDPMNAIPAAKLGTLGKAARFLDKIQDARSFKKGFVLGAGAVALEEAAIHSVDSQRTLQESLLYVGIAGTLSGAIAHKLGKGLNERKAIHEKVLRALDDTEESAPGLVPRTNFSDEVDHELVTAVDIPAEPGAKRTITKGAYYLAKSVSGSVKLLSSPSKVIREATESMLNLPYFLRKNASRPTLRSYEQNLKLGWRDYYSYSTELERIWMKHLGLEVEAGTVRDALMPLERMTRGRFVAQQAGKLSYDDFDEMVTMYRMGAITADEVPAEVVEAAGELEKFYGKWEQRSQNFTQKLTEDIKQAVGIEDLPPEFSLGNYMKRRWNFAMIAEKTDEWVDFMVDQYRRNVNLPFDADVEAKVRRILKATARKMANSPERHDPMEIFSITINEALKQQAIGQSRESLRVLFLNFVNDAELYKTDWVLKSSRGNVSAYTKNAISDILFGEQFGTTNIKNFMKKVRDDVYTEFWTEANEAALKKEVHLMIRKGVVPNDSIDKIDVDEVVEALFKGDEAVEAILEKYPNLKTISREWNEALSTAQNNNKLRAVRALTKDEAKLLDDELDMLEVLTLRARGLYQDPSSPAPGSTAARFIDGAMKYSNLTTAGTFMISSIPDLFRPVMHMGIKRSYGKNLKALFDNEVWEAMGLASRELRSWGLGNELYFSQRLPALVGDVPKGGAITQAEKLLGKGNDAMFILNGLNIWNEFMKKNVGISVVDEIVSLASDQSKITPKQWRRLHQMGLDRKHLRFIDEQFRMHGRSVKGVNITNFDDWDVAIRFGDEAAREKWWRTQFPDVDFDIVYMKPGDDYGNPAMAFMRTEGDKHTIYVDRQRVAESFRDKAWLKPKMKGVEPLRNSDFTYLEDWEDFIIYHEINHIKNPPPWRDPSSGIKRTSAGVSSYEDATNKQALAFLNGHRGQDPTEIMMDDVIAAIQKEVDNIIVTPGVGDTPNLLSNSYVAMIAQYKTFALAATTQMLLRGLQEPDANFLTGLLMSTVAGMTVAKLRYSDREFTTEELLAEGIESTGFLGALGMGNSMITHTPLGELTFGDWGKHYDFDSFLMGPSASLANNVKNAMFEDGEKQDNAAAKLYPFRNLFYIDALLKTVETGKTPTPDDNLNPYANHFR